MGDRVYYVTYMKFVDVEQWIHRTDQIHKSKMLREMIQRELQPRSKIIANYLLQQSERFFSAIVVGVYGGEPQWYPINVDDSPVLGNPELDSDSRDSIGLLKLSGDEKLFAIDGQHRVEAIKEAISQDPELGLEELSVIFVAHEIDDEGRECTRRLFTTLNHWAKPVSKGEIVALDEDDAFAIVTRRLVEEFPLLKSESREETRFVDFGKQAQLNQSDRKSLTSILTLYDLTYTIHVPIKMQPTSREKFKRLKLRRPSDTVLDEIYEQQTEYWTILKDNFPEYQELFNSNPQDEVAGKYRDNAGHLMFRPIGQKAFAKVVRIMMDRSWVMKDAIASLASVPMALNEPPWKYVLWNPSTTRINSKVSSQLPESIFLYYIGEMPRKKNYNLLHDYRRTLDDQKAELPSVNKTNPNMLPLTYSS